MLQPGLHRYKRSARLETVTIGRKWTTKYIACNAPYSSTD